MADQMFYDARDLGWHTIEYDVVDGAQHKMLFAGMWRSRFDLAADAVLSPLKQVNVHDQRLNMKMRANASVVPA